MPTDNYTITTLKEGYITNVSTNTFTDNQPSKTITLQDEVIPEVTVKCVSQTGAAVGSVEVTLDDTERVVPLTAFTNSQGVATFTNVRSALYELTCEKELYDTYEDEIELTKTSHHVDVELTQVRIQTADVYVKTQQGAAIPNANVILDGATTTPVSRTTDSNGHAEFTYMKIENYDVQVTCTGYNTYTGTASLSPENHTLNIALEPDNFSITLTVKDNASNIALEGIDVSIQKSGGTKATATTDSKGSVTFTNRSSGTYAVSASDALQRFDTYTNNVNFNKGSNTHNVSLVRKVASSAYVSVSKLDGSSTYVQGAHVKYTDRLTKETFERITDPRGIVEFLSMKDGYYDLDVTAFGLNAYHDEGIRIKKDDDNEKYVIMTKATSVQVDIHVQREKDNADISGATVTMTPSDYPEYYQERTTNQFGNVKFTDFMYPGQEYEIKVEHPDYETDIITRTVSQGGNNITRSLAVKEKQVTFIQIRVNEEDSHRDVPNPGVKITSQKTGESRTGVGDSRGWVNFDNVNTGWYTVDVEADYFEDYHAEDVLFKDASTPVYAYLTHVKTSVKINVRQEITQTPIEGAKVTLTPPTGIATVQFTNASGKVEWPNQNSGTYGVKIEAEGYTTFEDNVNFYPGHDTDNVTLERAELSYQTIGVNDSLTHSGIAGATVTIEDVLTGETYTETTSTSAKQAVFYNILAGEYEVTVSKQGYATYTGTHILKGNYVGIDLVGTLLPEVTVTVTKYETGSTFEGIDVTVDDGVNPPTTSFTGTGGKITFHNKVQAGPILVKAFYESTPSYYWAKRVDVSSVSHDIDLAVRKSVANAKAFVKNSAGAYVEGVEVILENEQYPLSPVSGVTDAEGKYEFGPLPYEGDITYNVTAKVNGVVKYTGTKAFSTRSSSVSITLPD